jgi:hypothetical protein
MNVNAIPVAGNELASQFVSLGDAVDDGMKFQADLSLNGAIVSSLQNVSPVCDPPGTSKVGAESEKMLHIPAQESPPKRLALSYVGISFVV